MKNCVSKEKLFDYYHSELEKEEMDFIDAHINVCEDCKHLLSQIESEILLVKETINNFNPEYIEIPEFSLKRSHSLNNYNKMKILGWAASISLLITISTLATQKIIHNQKPVNDYEYFQYIPDINDAWKENSITVTCYDENGNPIDHQVIKN